MLSMRTGRLAVRPLLRSPPLPASRCAVRAVPAPVCPCAPVARPLTTSAPLLAPFPKLPPSPRPHPLTSTQFTPNAPPDDVPFAAPVLAYAALASLILGGVAWYSLTPETREGLRAFVSSPGQMGRWVSAPQVWSDTMHATPRSVEEQFVEKYGAIAPPQQGAQKTDLHALFPDLFTKETAARIAASSQGANGSSSSSFPLNESLAILAEDGIVPAPYWRRVLASLLDLSLVSGAVVASLALVRACAPPLFNALASPSNRSTLVPCLLALNALLDAIALRLTNGQTPGKRALRLRTCRRDFEPLGTWSALKSAIVRTLLSLNCYLDVLTQVRSEWRHQGRLLHNVVSGTIVMYEPALIVDADHHHATHTSPLQLSHTSTTPAAGSVSQEAVDDLIARLQAPLKQK